MLIFDYFRVILVLNTKKGHFWAYGLSPIPRQRKGIMFRCMFRWKALVISFSKIYKSIYNNEI